MHSGQTIHGVFVEVRGLGVLLTGASGVGKSEVALALIKQGHRLVADDAPEFHRHDPDTVRGVCPALLRDFLQVTGLGVINIRAMFGDDAVKPAHDLHLIVELKPIEINHIEPMERLTGSYRTRTLLDVAIAEVTIPVAPGRNLAVLVETAIRHYDLLRGGYNAAQDFMLRQQQLLQE